MPTSKQIYQMLQEQDPTPVPKTYTEKQLVDFGNYLLSRERNARIYDANWHKDSDVIIDLMRVVHQEDIDNALGESKTIPNI